MGSKFHQKSIFESGFDSFEFDDGFLMRIDSDLKNAKFSEKQHDVKKFNSKVDNLDCFQEKNDKKMVEIKSDYYDLPLFIEHLDESDFFDVSSNKNKKNKSKVAKVSSQKDEKSKNELINHFTSCLSPILGPKSTTQLNVSSSTPVRQDTNKEEITQKENSTRNYDYVFSEADLFDDWDVGEVKKENPATTKSTVTMSQVLKLIEEAELERDRKEPLNESINLLTGEVVGVDVKVMFDESFDAPESDGKQEVAESSDDSVIIVKESKTGPKPSAAQKLKFESDEVRRFNSATSKDHFVDVFNSDDDFDFLTQDLLDEPKDVSDGGKRDSKLRSATSLNDSVDGIICFKKRRNFKIIESDTGEDSPSPKFRRQNKGKTKKRRNCQENSGKEFIDSEAEVSDEVEVSSDEAEEEGEYDKSFLDEESYFTQNNAVNMTSKYLESVKAVTGPGGFKIPAPEPYNPDNIFSQIPEENDTDYEIDSFCVNDVEEEMKTDLSDLEVAEKILEMDRRKRKRKRSQKFRNYK